MTIFEITECRVLQNIAEEQVVLATGKLQIDGRINLPHAVSIVLAERLNTVKSGQSVDLSSGDSAHYNVLSFTNELLGSSLNGGILWYGKTATIEHLHNKLMLRLTAYVENNTRQSIEGEEQGELPELLRWNFTDGTSLMLLYIDRSMVEFSVSGIYAEQVISFEFGKVANDMTVADIIHQTLLRAVGQQHDDQVADSSVNLQVGNKLVTAEDNLLFLNLARHLLGAEVGTREQVIQCWGTSLVAKIEQSGGG